MNSPRTPAARRRALKIALLSCALAATLPAAHAATDENANAPDSGLTFNVAPGITAHVTHIGEKRVTVRLAPGGKTQQLRVTASDEDGHYGAETKDFNFDGYQDLAFRATLGQVNDTYQVFLYDPSTQRFVELQPPSKGPAVSCEGFWNLTTDPKTHTLLSSCRGGPMWFTDAYRYDADGHLYVYQTSHEINNDAVQKLLDPPTKDVDGIPRSIQFTYDAQRKLVARNILAAGYEDRNATGHVGVARLALHERPVDGPTRRYLVKGDGFEAEDLSDDEAWLKVAYRNSTKGVIEGWIKVSEAAAGE